MCLSTAYLDKKDDDRIVARYVASIEVRGDRVLLTDVVGGETEIQGRILSVDLTGGVVILSGEAA